MPKRAEAGTGRALVPSDRARAAMVRRLKFAVGAMSTEVTRAMDEDHPWFRELGANERSWIGMVATAGIEGFADWFADAPGATTDPAAIFAVAPRALTRKVSLQQTVDLIRTTIDVVEAQVLELLPRSDRVPLLTALGKYSREVAFGAADLYAGVAESRGAWDEHTEAVIVDAIVRGESDESLLSRASTLGWPPQVRVFVLAGASPAPGGDPGLDAPEALRQAAAGEGLQAMAAVQGGRMVAVLGGVPDPDAALGTAERLRGCFGEGPLVAGPVVDGLRHAWLSARDALSGADCAAAWPEGPPVLAARDLLPERVLSGSASAARELVATAYQPLAEAGGDLLLTLVALLDHGCSVEATARDLYVHANTVRYRAKRIQEITGYSPGEPRGAFVLRLAVVLGRLGRG
jgi:hypothetical protein